jgi:hypothetical protein
VSTHLSIADALARLKAQIAFHTDREAHHTQQEEHHRVERARHAADLEKVTRDFEQLQAIAGTLANLGSRAVLPMTAEMDNLGPGKPKLARMVARVLQGPVPERFGPTWVTQEVEARFGEVLRGRVDSRRVSIVLRRMAQSGRIHQVRRGRPHWEALYAREKPAKSSP